jgi:putative sugar O-methyltransferase
MSSSSTSANAIASKWLIHDDRELLDLMMFDSGRTSALYRPGRFWASQARSAVNAIRTHGLTDFRGRSNGIGLSYADKVDHDIRHSLNFGARRILKFAFDHIFPFNRVMDGQIRLTLRIADDANREKSAWLRESPRIRQLMSDYSIPYSVGGGCTSTCEINGLDVSIHYLALLDTLDNIQQRIDMRTQRSYFEIGGGFGVNVHLLLTNFPNFRKVVYLDIPPNLYVGTQYLRSHFPGAVKDYRDLRSLRSIKFADDDSLEILCVAPWQVESIDARIDIAHNAHSFVEMPAEVVENYSTQIERLRDPDRGAVALVSYDSSGISNTVASDTLTGFFRSQFAHHTHPVATSPGTTYHYYISN